MKTENKTENSNILTEIKNMLETWKQAKATRKETSDFFKTENKIKFVSNLNQKIVSMYIKSGNKSGFLAVFDTDIFKIFLKPFYEKNNIFLKKEIDGKGNERMRVSGEIETIKTDLQNCLDFSSYAFAKIDENKKRERERKQKLETMKTGISLKGLTPEKLDALILQARQAKKQYKKD